MIPTQNNVMPMIVKTTRPTIRLANNTSIMNMTINAITDPMPMQQISRDLSISLLSLFIISTTLSLILEKGYGVGSSLLRLSFTLLFVLQYHAVCQRNNEYHQI